MSLPLNPIDEVQQKWLGGLGALAHFSGAQDPV
jgi:hypothetical protein